MLKRNLKLFAALLAVVLVAGAGIFYACTKDISVVNNPTKEAEFVAKNYDGTCVQVDVFRDENNNAQFLIKSIADNPDVTLGLIVSNTLSINHMQPKGCEDNLVFEIPNDAIYWLVPLDGYKPVKFEPIYGAKDVPGGSSGSLSINCSCEEWISQGCTGNNTKCEKRYYSDGKWRCAPAINSCCTDCKTHTSGRVNSNSSEFILVGSTFLVQSNSITLNGIVYE